MKVYTKVVINMKTLEEIEIECFDCDDEPIYCKGGGGGGSSGKVSYPAYLETIHSKVLDHTTADAPISSIVEEMNVVLGSNPYTGVTAYNPGTRLTDAWTVIDAYEAIVVDISDTVGWAAMFGQAVTTIDTNYVDPTLNAAADIDGDWDESQPGSIAEIEADVAAYEDVTDDRVETDVLPRFQRGMQDINSVMTSAFTIGQAVIEGMADRDIAKYHGTLRVALATQKDQIEAESVLEKNKQKAAVHLQDDRINAFSVMKENDMYTQSIESMIKHFTVRMQANNDLARTVVEANRISIVAEKEEDERQVSIDSRDALWNIEAFQYVGNLVAGIGGGTAVPNTPEGPSKMQSAMGGAMAGAAAGSAIAPGVGTAVGAGLGAVMGFFAG